MQADLTKKHSDYIQELHHIISKLSDEEIVVLKKYLKCFNNNKLLQVLELFTSSSLPSNILEEIENIAQSNASNTVLNLFLRLKKKIDEVVLLDINIYRKDSYEENFKTQFAIAKELPLIHIYFGRGLNKETNRILSGIIQRAIKFELYGYLLTALYFKRSFNYLNNESNTRLLGEIHHFEQCREALYKALNWHYSITTDPIFKGYYKNAQVNQEKTQILEKGIEELKEFSRTSKSARVNYYYYLVEMAYLQWKKEYHKAEKISLKLVELIKVHPAVKSKKRLGIAYFEHGVNDIYQLKFQNALKFLGLAKEHSRKNIENYSLYSEYEFFCHFYMANMKEAEKTLFYLIENFKNSKPFRLAKFHYYKATIYFLQKKHREVSVSLQEANLLTGDKEGWNIGYRVLSIMNHIERELEDIADLQIDAMRKHLGKLITQHKARSRDVLILKVLQRLLYTGFDFEKAARKEKDALRQLESENTEYSWNVLTPELIRFHQWFRSHLKVGIGR